MSQFEVNPKKNIKEKCEKVKFSEQRCKMVSTNFNVFPEFSHHCTVGGCKGWQPRRGMKYMSIVFTNRTAIHRVRFQRGGNMQHYVSFCLGWFLPPFFKASIEPNCLSVFHVSVRMLQADFFVAVGVHVYVHLLEAAIWKRGIAWTFFLQSYICFPPLGKCTTLLVIGFFVAREGRGKTSRLFRIFCRWLLPGGWFPKKTNDA